MTQRIIEQAHVVVAEVLEAIVEPPVQRVEQAPPAVMLALVEMQLQQGKERYGIDFESDILANLGDRFYSSRWPRDPDDPGKRALRRRVAVLEDELHRLKTELDLATSAAGPAVARRRRAKGLLR